MLKNRYQEILVGLNLMSLVRGLVSLKRNRSTLLIDDSRFFAESYHSNFLSELEIRALLRMGKKYDVPELQDLRQFLLPAVIEFVTDDFRLKLGASPLHNLKECLRKFPELIDASDLDLVYRETAEGFEGFFFEELARYEGLTYEYSQRPKAMRFDIQGPKWFKGVYKKLGEMLNREYSSSKDLKFSGLLHLLGLASEEKLKTCLSPEEIPFYFFRLLSPIFRLQDFFLMTQLKRRLLILGGDYKESSVQYWQLHERKFENLLLASFEGVISGDRVLFFSHLPEQVPFKIKTAYPIFRKTEIAPTKRLTTPFPPTSLTFITDSALLGSERPYRVLGKQQEMAYYQLPYPELPGSKAEFYENALTDAYIKDSGVVPFEKVASAPRGISSVTLDLRHLRENRKSEAPILTRLPISIADGDHAIQGFEYWGPFRFKGLGLLAICYGVEEI
jgi:hypothetical protein